MRFDLETLYALLPTIYRVRDTEHDGQLKALLGVIAEQVSVLEENLEQLYDDQFIETCAEWVVPYIGDMLGVRTLSAERKASMYSLRAHVAKTIEVKVGLRAGMQHTIHICPIRYGIGITRTVVHISANPIIVGIIVRIVGADVDTIRYPIPINIAFKNKWISEVEVYLVTIAKLIAICVGV